MEQNVFHFSHPHPLQFTTSSSNKTATTCFGCKLTISSNEDYYQCKTCPFSLHYVCSKMPLITNHPSHPIHDLVLLVFPSSPKATLNCIACGNHVIGFCYHCADCSIFFHSLCLALPLSILITNHPHKIKLESSPPPYDFFCDLCKKGSFNGWLYRCNMCEFDTHVACALENILESQLFRNHHSFSFSRTNALFGNLTSREIYDIMRLVAQQIGKGKEDFDCKVARKMNNVNSGKKKIAEIELQETEQGSVDILLNLEERTPLRDKLTPLSDHASNQFSDSYYFSIDLTKSCSNSTHERRNQVRKGVSGDQMTPIATQERTVRNSEQIEGDFEESSQKVVKKNPKESLVTKSESPVKGELRKMTPILCAVQWGIFLFVVTITVSAIYSLSMCLSYALPKGGKTEPFTLEEVGNVLPLTWARARYTVFEAHNIKVVKKRNKKLMVSKFTKTRTI